MAGRGRPKKFANEDRLLDVYFEFCEEIIENKFITIPSVTAFCRWYKKKYGNVDRKTVYNTLNKYFPQAKKDFEQMQSDIIMEGGLLGKYHATMAIFGLKNWCGWGDNVRKISEEETQDDALSKSLEELAGGLTSDKP